MAKVQIPHTNMNKVQWPAMCVSCAAALPEADDLPYVEATASYPSGASQVEAKYRFPICLECDAKRKAVPGIRRLTSRGTVGCYSIILAGLVLAFLASTVSLLLALGVAIAGVVVAYFVSERLDKKERDKLNTEYGEDQVSEASAVEYAVNLAETNAEYVQINAIIPYAQALRRANEDLIIPPKGLKP
ncbi:MAG: hypothetical protein ACE5G0_19310 [Rhodothermales bacterium]